MCYLLWKERERGESLRIAELEMSPKFFPPLFVRVESGEYLGRDLTELR